MSVFFHQCLIIAEAEEAKSQSQEGSSQAKDVQAKLPGLDVPIFTEEFLEHNKGKLRSNHNSPVNISERVLFTHIP